MIKHKDKFGKSRLGMFISEASKSLPEILGAGLKLASGDVRGAISEVTSILGVNKEKNEETKKLFQEFEKDKMEFSIEVFALEADDRKSARENGDKHLQRVVAYFSLIGFTVFGSINIWLCYQILIHHLDVNEFIIMTSSNIFGIFTGLLFTLKDFVFGGSIKD